MAIADNRQRYMPLPDDRLPRRGKTLAYPEAVSLVNPVEQEFKGEVCFEQFVYFYAYKQFRGSAYKLIFLT